MIWLAWRLASSKPWLGGGANTIASIALSGPAMRSDGSSSRSFISYDRDGAAPRLVGANIDITQRKETEAALKAQQATLADALAAGHVMAFEWDAITCRSRRSDNAAHILGDDDGEREVICATNSSAGPRRRSGDLQVGHSYVS